MNKEETLRILKRMKEAVMCLEDLNIDNAKDLEDADKLINVVKKMYWTLFVFKKGFKHYLVADENEENAWKKLANRQSISIKNCRKQYSLKTIINSNSDVLKI